VKINEIISDNIILEYENFSDIASKSINDPTNDEFGRQNNMTRRPGESRKPVISLRHIHKLKLSQAAKKEELENRKILMTLMYAQTPEETT